MAPRHIAGRIERDRPRGDCRGRLLLALGLALPLLGGCNILGRFSNRDDPQPSFPKLTENFDKEEIVAHLNENIAKLDGWRSNDVKFSGSDIPGKIAGSLAVAETRRFRLRARSLFRGDEADFGSNHERFWFCMHNVQKSVFTARHENVHLVQTRMDIPFDPDWLIESLGVIEIDPSRVALEWTDPKHITVDLFEERILANGQRARLVTTVDTNRGLIVGRSLYDPTEALIARATIREHEVHHPDRPDGGVVVPHEIRLEWPRENTKLVLEIGAIEINPPFSEESTVFTMPTIPGTVLHELDRDVVMNAPHGPGASFSLAELNSVEPIRRVDGSGFEDTLVRDFREEAAGNSAEREFEAPVPQDAWHGDVTGVSFEEEEEEMQPWEFDDRISQPIDAGPDEWRSAGDERP